MFRTVSLMALILACSLQSCATLKLDPPKVELVNIDLNNPTFLDATLIFNLLVKNPNKTEIKIDRLDYAVRLNKKPFSTGTLTETITLPPLVSTKVAVPVPMEFKALSTSMMILMKDGSLPYELEGKAKIGLLSIPFNEKGDLKISDLKN